MSKKKKKTKSSRGSRDKKKTQKPRKNRAAASKKQADGFKVDDKCKGCPALCCRYISLEIDTPEDREDFDNLRWYLLHKNVSVYVIDKKWHLCVDVPCRHLKNNQCEIHDSKPLVCRQHDPDECEFWNPDFEMDYEFRSWEELKGYMIMKRLSHLCTDK